MTAIKSSYVLLEDIYVNNSGNDRSASSNIDGANTIYSDNITFSQWSVMNGDDAIAIEASRTNIRVTNSQLYNGLGRALGSIGQYKGAFERIETSRLQI